MSWFHSPVKLFAYSGIALFFVRLVFPPADFPGARNLHSWVRFFDFQLGLTGYGLFEFVGLVFLISALTYWLVFRLTNRVPKPAVVQLHYWPTLLFGVCTIFLAHWVNRVPEASIHDPNTSALLVGFTWVFVVFLAFQFVFAIGAIRSMWRHRTIPSNSGLGPTGPGKPAHR